MNAHAPTYWGPQPMLSGPMYFGAIVCFLFVLSIFVVRNPIKWWVLDLLIFIHEEKECYNHCKSLKVFHGCLFTVLKLTMQLAF